MPIELDFTILDDGRYRVDEEIFYYSERYREGITVPAGYISDGATGAEDIVSQAWFVHDILCSTGKFDSGYECSNMQASFILYDILKSEGRWFRCRSWFVATLIGRPISNWFGGLFNGKKVS